jgi:hypothetical protein
MHSLYAYSGHLSQYRQVQNWKTSAENVTDPNVMEAIKGVSVAGRTPGCPCYRVTPLHH